jgi:hypothetical protein
VDGALRHRAFGPSGPLATLLEPHCTVFNWNKHARTASPKRKE